VKARVLSAIIAAGFLQTSLTAQVSPFAITFEDSPSSSAAKLSLMTMQGTLTAEALQSAWNQGDATLREFVLRLWIIHPVGWRPDPIVLANDPSRSVRFAAVLALANIPEGAPALAVIAVKDAGEPAICDAILSAAQTRKVEFIQALDAEAPLPSDAVLKMLKKFSKSLSDDDKKALEHCQIWRAALAQ
jgi:hypothetical protein